jgi:hypothetical protein
MAGVILCKVRRKLQQSLEPLKGFTDQSTLERNWHLNSLDKPTTPVIMLFCFPSQGTLL